MPKFVFHPLLNAAWLLLLSGYVLGGIPRTTFHGDEAMLIYASKDFNTAFVEGNPGQLTTQPPYVVDSDAHLRILNGSLSLYTMGLSLYLKGLEAERPTHLWQWWQSYDENITAGSRPNEAVLHAARIPAGVFLCLSISVMFALAWYFGGWSAAYLASLLYTLNPALLLNGRRAMHEGVLLFLGLSTLLAALFIAQRRAESRPALVGMIGFSLLCGLTLASKHSGIVYVVAGGGWIFLNDLLQHRNVLKLLGQALLVAGLGIATFVALSPALWHNPFARLGDLLDVRSELLASQVEANGATHLGERLEGIFTQVYLTEAQQYEAAFWDQSPAFRAEMADYNQSWWDGLNLPKALGGAMTLWAGIGLAFQVKRGLSEPHARALTVGLLVWLGVVVLTLLVNPLPWQRYYLPLYPLVILLSSLGLVESIGRIRQYVTLPNGG